MVTGRMNYIAFYGFPELQSPINMAIMKEKWLENNKEQEVIRRDIENTDPFLSIKAKDPRWMSACNLP